MHAWRLTASVNERRTNLRVLPQCLSRWWKSGRFWHLLNHMPIMCFKFRTKLVACTQMISQAIYVIDRCRYRTGHARIRLAPLRCLSARASVRSVHARTPARTSVSQSASQRVSETRARARARASTYCTHARSTQHSTQYCTVRYRRLRGLTNEFVRNPVIDRDRSEPIPWPCIDAWRLRR